MAINPNRKVALLLLFSDALTVAVVFNAVTFARGVTQHAYLWPLAAPVFVFVVSLHLIDGYGARSDMVSLDYASVHLIASAFAAFTTLFLTFAVMPPGFELHSSRAAILISFIIVGPLSLAYRRMMYVRTAAFQGQRFLIYVGGEEDFGVFRAECARLGTNLPLLFASDANRFEAFEKILESTVASKIVVEAIVIKESGKDLPSEIPMKLVQMYFEGIPTYTLEIFHQVYWRKIPLYRINPTWLFQEGFQIAREPVFERVKRVSDIILSGIGLIVFSPVIALAAIAIKLDDGGSVFFAQQRIGIRRIGFRLIKLRTMRASDSTGDLYTLQGDARITRAGRLLRAARLDELPQLWNVLRGEMSLIGPRAEWDRLVEKYEREIPCYHFRHLVKPGITGWAQINYRYGAGVEDTLRKLEYDLYYIRNFSFMLDASIVLKTFHVMLLQKGR